MGDKSYWRKIPESDPWEYYLSNLNVNSFYYASELVITGVLVQLALTDDVLASHSAEPLGEEQAGFAEACRLNNEISGKLLAVLGEFIAVIISETIPDISGEKADIGKPGKLSQLSLPFFWNEDDYDRCLAQDTQASESSG